MPTGVGGWGNRTSREKSSLLVEKIFMIHWILGWRGMGRAAAGGLL